MSIEAVLSFSKPPLYADFFVVHEAIHWTCPTTGMIKLNVDVWISKSHTTSVVVARDEKEAIIKAWAKDNPLYEPLNAEANAILWCKNHDS
jgi:hypothetical protein